MPVQVTLWPKFAALDNNGIPLANGQLFTYLAGTSTPQATFTDSTGVTPNTNPVILNSRGEADVWVTEGVSYKFILQDALNTTIWTVDHLLIPLPPTAAQLLPPGVTITQTNFTFNAAAFNNQPVIVASGFHDAGVIILGIRWEVTQQWSNANGLLTLRLGDPGQTDRWGSGMPLIVGEQTLRFGGFPVFPTATDLVLSAEGGLFGSTGQGIAHKTILTLP